MKKIIYFLFILLLLTGCKEEHTHVYKELVINPTCTSNGYILHVCDCGDQYQDNESLKLEHSYINGICERCGEKIDYTSNNLEYVLNEDQLSYSVVGIGSCLDTKVIIPSEYNSLPVTSIKDAAFKNIVNLEKLIIPDSIIMVGKNILKGVDTIESITMPYIYGGYIGYLFGAESSSYNSSSVPNSLKEIKITQETNVLKNAFSNCTNIESVEFVRNLVEIEKNAFYNCKQLNNIVLPESLVRIHENAFYDCINLETVYFNGYYDSWFNVLLDSKYSTPMYYGSHFFYKNDNLYEELINIEIPKQVTNLNDFQLYGFKSVTSILINNELKGIGTESLNNLLSLEQFITLDNDLYESVDGVLYTKNLEQLISYPCSKKDSVYTINPNTLIICDGAFLNNKYIEEIHFNDKVNTIGKFAFSYCSNLKSCILPNNVEIIEEGLFKNCENLINVYLHDSITSINTSAFELCVNLESIYIPISVNIIEAYAFRNCSKLTIYCEAGSKPSGWVSSYWNVYPSCPVLWDQKR